jgi:hypothetical protein
MPRARIAIVGRDAGMRRRAAAAFDEAPSTWTVELHHSPPPDADAIVVCPGMDAPGAVAFDPARPRDVLQNVEGALAGSAGDRLVVTGAGRGCGVTSLALSLAEAFAAAAPTCYLDLDLELGAGDRLGMSPEEARTWADGVGSGPALDRSAHPVRGGFRVLLAPPPAVDADPREALSLARERFARVVVDCPHGGPLPAALEGARAGVLVFVPSPPGARRARRVLESLPGIRWAVVANRLGPGGETTRAELQQVLGCPIAFELPCCAGLRDSEDDFRVPLGMLSRWRRAVHRLARALESR